MDSQKYREERERECAEASATCRDLEVGQEKGPGAPPLAQLIGRAELNERAFVKMQETVELHQGHVHRIRYAYYLSFDGEEIGGYERSLVHGEHFHCTHRHRGHLPGGEPAGPVSFKEAVNAAWDWLSDHGYPPPGARRQARRLWRLGLRRPPP